MSKKPVQHAELGKRPPMTRRTKRKVQSEVMWMAWHKVHGFLPGYTSTRRELLRKKISAVFLGDKSNCVRVRITAIPARGVRRKG